MSTPRHILVTGATGKQGGALITALLSLPSQSFKISALTRDTSSRSAQKLANQSPNISLIQGDFKNIPAFFSELPSPLWGIFIMTTPLKGTALEETQGLALVSAAVEAKVSHIVFTATDRGGETVSDDTATSIPHFVSKYNIEREILRRAEASDDNAKVTYTFLRPVAFFENLTDDFFGKGFVAMWRLNGGDRKLQMIGTSDIGKIAADAFVNFDNTRYRNQAISLASDEVSPDEGAKIFKEVTGKEIPSTFGFVGWGLKSMMSDLGSMFNWFKSDGFGVDVSALRKEYPLMMDFKTWLRTESAWKEK